MKKYVLLFSMLTLVFSSCTTLAIPQRESKDESLIALSVEFRNKSSSSIPMYFFVEINNEDMVQVKPGLNIIKVNNPKDVVITFIGMKGSKSKYENWYYKLDEDIMFTPEPDKIIICQKKIVFGTKQYHNTGTFLGNYELLNDKEIMKIENKILKSQKKSSETQEFSVQ